MVLFLAELRKNNYPSASSFAQLLREMDLRENTDLSCDPRTIHRDIDTLIHEYKAPIEYDPSERGYFLRNPDWNFTIPAFPEEVCNMLLLGTTFAAAIVPEPLRSKLNKAIAYALTNNSFGLLDEAMMNAIFCDVEINAPVDSRIFQKVFDAWRRHQVLRILYQKANGETSQRIVEPHLLAFRRGVWYLKGYEQGNKTPKCFALQRILEASPHGKSFTTDKKLIRASRGQGLFDFPKVENVRLRCDPDLAQYIREQQNSHDWKCSRQKNGFLLVSLPPVFEHEILHWILANAGYIEVLAPLSLRQKVKEWAQSTVDLNR